MNTEQKYKWLCNQFKLTPYDQGACLWAKQLTFQCGPYPKDVDSAIETIMVQQGYAHEAEHS